MDRRLNVFLILLLLASSAATIADEPSRAAHVPQNLSMSARVPVDRDAAKILENARKAIQRREFASAMTTLQGLLDREEEMFLRDADMLSTINESVNRLISNLPSTAFRFYERQFGSTARTAFNNATSPDHFRKILRRYRNTQAGLDVLKRMAALSFDEGENSHTVMACLAALKHPRFEPATQQATIVRLILALVRTQRFTRATQVLKEYQPVLEQFGDDGRRTTMRWTERLSQQIVAARESQIDSAGNWLIDRGRADRNGVTVGSLPSLQAAWEYPLEAFSTTAWTELNEHAIWSPTCFSPLLVDGTVVAGTLDGLIALDARTGKRLWEKHGTRVGRSAILRNPRYRSDPLLQRLQVDSVNWHASSDGERLFCIEPIIKTRSRFETPSPNQTRIENRLMAYDVKTGQPIWEINRRTSGFTDVLFRGPPLPYSGQLFVIAQQATALRLFVLNPIDGSIEWSLRLAEFDTVIADSTDQRMFACPITALRETLFCPTVSGIVVAVDLLARTRRWAYRYQRDDVPKNRGERRNPSPPPYSWWFGWRKASLIATSGEQPRLVVTSPESRHLHVLDGRTGKPIWSQPRGGALFVAGVFGTNVLVIEKYRVRAVDLATGKTIWRSRSEIPSARGFANKTHYFLPLLNGTLAAIQISDGTVRRISLASKPQLGNLVSNSDGTIGQTQDRISFYHPMSTALKLADLKPNESERRIVVENRIFNKASLECDAGDFKAAIKTLSHFPIVTALLNDDPRRVGDSNVDKQIANDMESHPAVGLLHRALLGQLQRDSGQLDRVKDRLRQLAAMLPAHKLTTLHSLARAARRNGRTLESLDTYLELLDLMYVDADGVSPLPQGRDGALLTATTTNAGPQRVVRFDRQLQGELIDLINESKPDDRDEFVRRIGRRLKAARASDDPFAMRVFSHRFSQLQWGRDARIRFPKQTSIGLDLLRTQLLFLEQSNTSRRSTNAWALLRLAELMTARNYRADAAGYYRRLRDEFGEVKFEDGKTPRDIIAGLAKNSLLAAAITSDSQDDWPKRKPTTTTTKRTEFDVYFHQVKVECEPGSLFDRLSVLVERTGNKVRFQGIEQDGFWELALPTSQNSFRFSHQLLRAWGLGGLLILRTGVELFAISPVDENGEPNADLLWTRNLADHSSLDARQRLPSRTGFGDESLRLAGPYSRQIGNVGPVRGGYLCYQRRGQLVAVEPSTGHVLWRRFDLPTDTLTTGNDDSVYIWSESAGRLEILRVCDGKTIAERSLPCRTDQILYLRGRQCLFESHADHKLAILKVDIDNGKLIWQRKFSEQAVPFAIDRENFGVVQGDGQLMLISRRTGKDLFAVRIEVPNRLKRIACAAVGDRIFLALSGPITNKLNIAIKQVRGTWRNKLIKGPLYCLDPQKRQIVWKQQLDNIAFAIDQPREVPFLVMNTRRVVEGANDSRDLEGVLQCVDKRSGTTIFKQVGSMNLVYFALNVNSSRKWVELQTPKQSIRIDYAESEDQSTTKSPGTGSGEP